MRPGLDCGKEGWLCERRGLFRPSLSEAFSMARLITPPLESVTVSAEVEE